MLQKKIEAGIYQPTTTKVIEGLSAEHLYDAHQIIESNQMIGKLVIKLIRGFEYILIH